MLIYNYLKYTYSARILFKSTIFYHNCVYNFIKINLSKFGNSMWKITTFNLKNPDLYIFNINTAPSICRILWKATVGNIKLFFSIAYVQIPWTHSTALIGVIVYKVTQRDVNFMSCDRSHVKPSACTFCKVFDEFTGFYQRVFR